MNQQKVGDLLVNVHDKAAGFQIQSKVSSNIEFVGWNSQRQVFVQFKNGVTYIYIDVDSQTIEDLGRAASVGAFVGSVLAKHYQSIKIDHRLVTIDQSSLDF